MEEIEKSIKGRIDLSLKKQSLDLQGKVVRIVKLHFLVY